MANSFMMVQQTNTWGYTPPQQQVMPQQQQFMPQQQSIFQQQPQQAMPLQGSNTTNIFNNYYSPPIPQQVQQPQMMQQPMVQQQPQQFMPQQSIFQQPNIMAPQATTFAAPTQAPTTLVIPVPIATAATPAQPTDSSGDQITQLLLSMITFLVGNLTQSDSKQTS
jgi:hypothetical protein